MTDRWYVSDPCYAIPNERWDEFCEKLFAHENYSRNGACLIEWEVDGEKYYVETWDSPGGDGVWNFHCGSFGVDAGLLAIIPEEVVMEAGEPYGGVWFDEEPELETCNRNYWVMLNGEKDNSWGHCSNCGQEDRQDNLEGWDCSECGECYCENCYDSECCVEEEE